MNVIVRRLCLLDIDPHKAACRLSVAPPHLTDLFLPHVKDMSWFLLSRILSSLFQQWLEGLRSVIHNFKANNVCPMTCLKKQ